MIIPLVLATISVTVIVFLAGYRLAQVHNSQQHQAWLEYLNGETNSLEPIFAKLDREYAYTDELSKPFTDDK
jgi:hypothetical protein